MVVLCVSLSLSLYLRESCTCYIILSRECFYELPRNRAKWNRMQRVTCRYAACVYVCVCKMWLPGVHSCAVVTPFCRNPATVRRAVFPHLATVITDFALYSAARGEPEASDISAHPGQARSGRQMTLRYVPVPRGRRFSFSSNCRLWCHVAKHFYPRNSLWYHQSV